jgi:pimeloyl-ACP methyl ester carboxylesterase
LHVLHGCGHVPAYSHPEAFAGAIRAFLSPVAPEAAPTPW